MASIEETLNRLREDNLKGIEDERIAREKETRARLDLLKDEKSLLREKKINAGKESIELRKQIKEKQKEKQKTGDFKLIATIERLTRELEKAEEAEKSVGSDLDKAREAIVDAARAQEKKEDVSSLVAGGTDLGIGTNMLIEEAKETTRQMSENEEILSLMKAEAEKQGLDINKNQKFLALSAKNDRMKMKLDGINAGRLQGMFKRFRASIPSREELKEQSRVFAGISGTLEGVAKGVGGFAKAAGSKTAGALGGIMGMIKGLMKGGLLIGALLIFRQFINSPMFQQLITLIKDTIIPAFQRMIEKLKPPIMAFVNYLGEVLPGVFNAIFGEGGLFDNAVSYFEGVMDLIKGIFTGDVDLIFGGIKKMFNSVVKAIDNIIKAILEFFGIENFSIIDKVKEIFTKIGDFIQGIIDNVVGVLRKIPLIGRFFKDEDAKKLGMSDEVEDSKKDKGKGRGRNKGKTIRDDETGEVVKGDVFSDPNLKINKLNEIPADQEKGMMSKIEDSKKQLLKLRKEDPMMYNEFIARHRGIAKRFGLTPVVIGREKMNPFAGQGQTAGGDTGGASIVDAQERSEANRFAGRGRGGKAVKRSKDARAFKEQQKLMNQSGITTTGGQLDQDTREYLARTGPQLAIDQKKPPVIINAPTTNVDGSTKTESVTFMSPSNPDKMQMLISESADL